MASWVGGSDGYNPRGRTAPHGSAHLPVGRDHRRLVLLVAAIALVPGLACRILPTGAWLSFNLRPKARSAATGFEPGSC